MNDKYELTDEMIKYHGVVLHRIRAIKNFPALGHDIKSGTYGGFIESEANLAFGEDDDCWIYDDAKVLGKARVQDHARVTGTAEVYGQAVIKDFASVNGNARVGGFVVLQHSERLNGGQLTSSI